VGANGSGKRFLNNQIRTTFIWHDHPTLLHVSTVIKLITEELKPPEGEIRRNIWLTCPADEALVFGVREEDLWAAALGRLGVDPSFLTAEAGEA
jgi:hypothetical protein